jgi:hypothetical protein
MRLKAFRDKGMDKRWAVNSSEHNVVFGAAPDAPDHGANDGDVHPHQRAELKQISHFTLTKTICISAPIIVMFRNNVNGCKEEFVPIERQYVLLQVWDRDVDAQP